jgi:hypothetical protein
MSQRDRKRWLWLLLIPAIPAAIVCVVLLPLALIVGGHVVGALVGPVNVWNSTTHIPPDAEIEGHYQISKDDSINIKNLNVEIPSDSAFTLGPDHRLEVHNLPNFDQYGKATGCVHNGTGKWDLYQSPSGVMFGMNITTVVPTKLGDPSCGPANFGSFAVLGRTRPYRFWYWIDDPDLGKGIMYKSR